MQSIRSNDLAELRKLRGLVIDMDGVLWHGDTPMPGIHQFFNILRQRQIKFVLATNNNTQTPEGFVQKAGKMGVEVQPELSAERHIQWCETPFQRVLSCAPSMYDELWTGAKAMYKLEPAVAVGGEVVIYAPHLDTVSHVHGKYIYEVGYHILPYFLNDWEQFKHLPLGVLAHSTHLRGSGVMENGIEKPNVRVILASKISADDCARLNLGYLDPAKINVDQWKDREGDAVLYVPKAGEILYRLKT